MAIFAISASCMVSCTAPDVIGDRRHTALSRRGGYGCYHVGIARDGRPIAVDAQGDRQVAPLRHFSDQRLVPGKEELALRRVRRSRVDREGDLTWDNGSLVGGNDDPADGRHAGAAHAMRRIDHAADDLGRAGHGVPSQIHRGRAGVVGATLQRDQVLAVAGDPVDDADRDVLSLQMGTLLDVQLDERLDVVATRFLDPGGIESHIAHGLRHRHTVVTAQPPRFLRRNPSDDRPRPPEVRGRESGRFLLDQRDDPDRLPRLPMALAQCRHRERFRRRRRARRQNVRRGFDCRCVSRWPRWAARGRGRRDSPKRCRPRPAPRADPPLPSRRPPDPGRRPTPGCRRAAPRRFHRGRRTGTAPEWRTRPGGGRSSVHWHPR